MILFGNQQNRSINIAYGYGMLYNWYAVNGDSGSGTKQLAPVGWHVPTDAEWTTLTTYLGGTSVAGGKMKSTRTEPTPAPRWLSPNTGATNESGFTGLPGGYRNAVGSFLNRAYNGYWWSSSQYDSSLAWLRYLYYLNANVYWSPNNKAYGFSVRCLKDDSNWYPGMIVKDIDGNLYLTVKIGNQVWMKSNLKVTKYTDGTAIPNVTNGGTWAGLTTGAYCSYNNLPINEYTEKYP